MVSGPSYGSDILNIKYRPEFRRDVGEISGGYDIPPVDVTVTDDDDIDDVLEWANVADTIDDTIGEIYGMIDEQTVGMYLSVDDPAISNSVRIISSGDHDNYVNGADWSRAHGILNNQSILGISERFNLSELLWAEIKARIGEWLSTLVEKVPIIGKDLAQRLRDNIAEARRISLDASIGMDNLSSPMSLTELADISGVQHAQNVVTFIREEIGRPQALNFNANAVAMRGPLDNISASWDTTRTIINTSYGIQVTRVDQGGSLGNWLRKEGAEIVGPLRNSYSQIRERISSTGLMKYGVTENQQLLDVMRRTLREYTTGDDLACCLLNNLLGISRLMGDPLKFLRILRIALLYGFNGLTVGIGSIVDILADIFNVVISIAMGKIMRTLEEYLINHITSLRNYLMDYARSKGEAWIRCYPFDELMSEVLRLMYEMEKDLLGYILDFTNSLNLSNTNMTKYILKLQAREFQRKSILLLDSLIRGIETGILCKDLRSIGIEYSPPTPEELLAFTNDPTFRDGINIDEARRRYMRAPDSGVPLDGNVDLEGKDMQWLQDCNKSMNEEELADIARGLKGAGII